MFSRLTRTDDNTYDLYAVANHKGNMQSGHYTAYCRNPIDNCWYLFDDTKVVAVNESSVITADAYILFYQRSSLSSALSSCASSSTSGYSSSASSYYSDHWAFRMPPFNYWSPKASKSHDNLSSEVINENMCQKREHNTTADVAHIAAHDHQYLRDGRHDHHYGHRTGHDPKLCKSAFKEFSNQI
ncbi:unnamed protein product [Medioppia subpectinata]|uniref:ubiquitinyl hydrolase 1 n=1 Tax=Medioppia subpectinata TaxID=1979941 RepID=A0A7R9QKU6_9ACAR|nr:unnamed protein product [Medioppia subpectinata]CAG2122039.1 unnamed protein product [Medioppia subpectinata]